jgi:hypothetical protein
MIVDGYSTLVVAKYIEQEVRLAPNGLPESQLWNDRRGKVSRG